MINWQDMEERVDIYGQEAAAVGLEASERAEFIDEFESEHNLRRRVASVLINLGVRLDPSAAGSVAANN